MGNGAFSVLTYHSITVYRDCSGNVDELVKLFILGQVNNSGELCHAHGNNHKCNHKNINIIQTSPAAS